MSDANVGWSIKAKTKKMVIGGGGGSKRKAQCTDGLTTHTHTHTQTWCVFQSRFEIKATGSCLACLSFQLPVQKVLASSVAPLRVAECTATSEEY